MQQAHGDDVTPEPNLIVTMARSLAILLWPYQAMMLVFYLDRIGVLSQRVNPSGLLMIAAPAMYFFLPIRNTGAKILLSLVFVPILSAVSLTFLIEMGCRMARHCI